MESKICQYSKCGKSFTTESKKKKYCSDNCRVYDFAKNKQVKKVVLTPDVEDGKFIFMNPDGTTRKCKLVWIDEEYKIEQGAPINAADSKIDVVETKKCDIVFVEMPDGYPTSFQELLTMAKNGVEYVDNFKHHISTLKLAPNQKSMILSKLPK